MTMKKIKKLLIALLLLLPLAVTVFQMLPMTAAPNDPLFKTLDAREGLTSSQVNCILKDSRG